MAALVRCRWGYKVIWSLLKIAPRFFRKMERIYTVEIFSSVKKIEMIKICQKMKLNFIFKKKSKTGLRKTRVACFPSLWVLDFIQAHKTVEGYMART